MMTSYEYTWLAKNYWILWALSCLLGLLFIIPLLGLELNQDRYITIIGLSVAIGICYLFIDRSNKHLFGNIALSEDGLHVKRSGKSLFIQWSKIRRIEDFPTSKTHTLNNSDPDVNLGAGGVRIHIENDGYFVIYRRISKFKELIAVIEGKINQQTGDTN